MTSHLVIGIVKRLPDLATAVWVGGLIAMALVLLPSIRQVFGKGPQTRKLARVMQDLSFLVYGSIVVLVDGSA